MHTSLRALVLVAFYCVLALSKCNGTTTVTSSVSPGYQHGAGCFGLGVFFSNILPSSVRVSVRARSVGFCCTKFSLARWSKHGSTCLVITGHDPPLDITVWMDISRNPGPSSDLIDICSGGHNLVHGGNLHTSSSTRTTSTSNNGPGARFGIPSLITMRPTVTSGYNRPVFRTLTDVPIDRSQCFSLGTNSMKLYNLNARSISTALWCRDSISVTGIAAGEKKSFENGIFADQWKCALVHPLLKKLGLEPIFRNFRPVSNLQYISKLTEKAVFIQTHGQMVTNNITSIQSCSRLIANTIAQRRPCSKS